MPATAPGPPLVSVGVAVFNEEAYLPAALDSLLAQDYERMQIIVCDNASTDGTVAIAEEYAERDSRIEVHRNEENCGVALNWNRCFRFARGKYFTWASGHDTRDPSAVRKCVEALEDDPSLVLVYPRAVWRRYDGSLDPLLYDRLETRGLPRRRRLAKTIYELGLCNIMHGVIRTSALERTRLFRRCHGFDNVLIAELSLLGEFHQLDEALLVRTENRPRESMDEILRRTIEMTAVRRGPERWSRFTVMGLEHVAGVWHVSSGQAKVADAMRCAVWFSRRWRRELRHEWLSIAPPPVQAAVRRTRRELTKLRVRET